MNPAAAGPTICDSCRAVELRLTADSNAAVFDAALRELGRDDVRLRHAVRADLLDRAERDGGLTAAIVAETAAVLGSLAGESDAVLLTCSTLGPAVSDTTQSAAPVLRVDEALARQAVRQGGTVVALCAVATTVPSTRELFERYSVELFVIIINIVVKGDFVKETQGGHGDEDGTGSQLFLLGKIHLVGTNILRPQLVRCFAEMPRKQRYLQNVSGLRVWREIAHLHIFDHALTKRSHGKLLCEMECAASSPSMLSHRGAEGIQGRQKRYRMSEPSASDKRDRATRIPRSGLVQT